MTIHVEWQDEATLVVLDHNNNPALLVHVNEVGDLIDKLTNESERDLDDGYLTVDLDAGGSLCLARPNAVRGAELEVDDVDTNLVVRAEFADLLQLCWRIDSEAVGMFTGGPAERDRNREGHPYSWSDVCWTSDANATTLVVTEHVGQDPAGEPEWTYEMTLTLTAYERGRLARQAHRFGGGS